MANQPTEVITGEVRLSYVNLFTPRANKPGQEPKYSVTILVPKSDTSTKQRIDAAIQVAYEKGVQTSWNGARPQLDIVVHDGDGVRPKSGDPFGPECRGHWVLTASSKQPQQVVDLQLNPIIDQMKVYSGVYGRVHINFYPFNNNGGRGVGAGLGPVQITRDGEPLGGRTTAEAAFGGLPAPSPQQGYAPAPPAYQQPQPYAQPGYAQPQYGYNQPAPAPVPPQASYAPPATPQQPYAQPQYGYGQPAPQPVQPQPYGQPAQIDPITGKPATGAIWGL
ncbi:hypothetical protein HMPREF0322_00424 [Desulfitobacterium hafniense DP7]|uniref:DUF2815 family protein n=1 Tax=Desulfitobacterium hafniense DP7 TaxID=537010 RepID=G9XHJ9_DESHA|nr:DUF2815 family protein [Desulfitobacterium hafniense]EHL08782.1 hypothetical protein HMPREF0322_00424 [Desulfitobacterium hafniense DP7]